MFNNMDVVKSVCDREGIILYYSGLISYDLVIQVADVVRHKMRVDEVASSTRLKVFSAVIEQLQNILRYSFDVVSRGTSGGKDKEMRRGMIVVGYEDDLYYVSGGNLIDNSKIPALRDRLSMLQGMSRSELKQHFKAQRRGGPGEDSRGAGLGIIELARKASAPIQFDFTPAGEHTSFFALKTII